MRWTKRARSSVNTVWQKPNFMRLATRRIAAYCADYFVMTAWIGGLVLLANTDLFRLSVDDGYAASAPWMMQAQAFALLTLPVWLYLTLFEAFGRRATPGKQLAGLRVEGSLGRIAFRNGLKLLPWEIAHTGIWHGIFYARSSSDTALAYACFAGSIGLTALYLARLFMGQGRTPYDRLSGTQVFWNSV